MNNIYIVGFMGTGKTTAGKEIAGRKAWNFIDLDELIELRERRRIADIFARSGEPYFRKAEQAALKEVAREKNFVVACGGGIVIDKENIKIMRESGYIVCLRASPDEILKRTGSSKDRPLLNVPDPKKQITHLLKLRAPFYARADSSIDTTGLSAAEVASKVMKLISQKKKRLRRQLKKLALRREPVNFFKDT